MDSHAGDRLRVFTELQFDDENGRNGGPRPGIDQDPGDILVDVSPALLANDGVTLRVGRQELIHGSRRFFDNNEGVNVKFSFDAVRPMLRKGR